jgi:hypothetical protein
MRGGRRAVRQNCLEYLLKRAFAHPFIFVSTLCAFCRCLLSGFLILEPNPPMKQ